MKRLFDYAYQLSVKDIHGIRRRQARLRWTITEGQGYARCELLAADNDFGENAR